MFFCEVNNRAARWSGLAALMALGFSASAQEDIQYSKQGGDDAATKPNTRVPDATQPDPSSYNAPAPMFRMKVPNSSYSVLPGSPSPAISPAAAAQWQKLLDNRKNWTLMTAEEILNLPTPEKNMGITDPNDDANLPAEQRFLKRQQQKSQIGSSNAWHRAESAFQNNNNDNVFGNGNASGGVFQPMDVNARFAGTSDGSALDQSKNHVLFFGQRLIGGAPDAIQKPASAWVSPFNLPDPLPKQTPEQLAGMERFRSLMSGATTEKAPVPTGFPGLSTAAPNPNMQQMPAFNPAGTSFRALENDITGPTRLTPLSGVTGPRPPAPKPVSLTQPPPWMQSSFQNPVLPQRQF